MNQRIVTERTLLRRELLAGRASLSPGFRQRAAQLIARRVAATSWLHAAAAIALYVSIGAELDTRPLRRLARRRGCRIFLPRISNYRRRQMRLCADTGGPLRANRYGICEPPPAISVSAATLDVIFVPVVGFDDQGNRLGMGAGYYDRYLAGRRPLLVGLAYERSHVTALPMLPHDVRLDAVVTESGIHRYPREVRP